MIQSTSKCNLQYIWLNTFCTLPEVQHSTWASAFCTAGISRSCGKADLNWLLRELRHTRHRRYTAVTSCCFCFPNTLICYAVPSFVASLHFCVDLQARAVRSRETGEAAGAHIVHPFIHHFCKMIIAYSSNFLWFYEISTIGGYQGQTHVRCASWLMVEFFARSKVEDLDLRDLDDLFWWQKKMKKVRARFQRISCTTCRCGARKRRRPNSTDFFCFPRSSAGPKWRCAELGV